MMSILKPLKIRAVLMTLCFISVTAILSAAEPWKVPKIKAKKKNPVLSSVETIEFGKQQYSMLCMVCHGTNGAGDGPAAQGLHPKPTDLTSPAVQGQSDGALFFKISKGRAPMPTFGGLSKENRWKIIHYLRTLKRSSP